MATIRWKKVGKRMRVTRLALGLTEQQAAGAWRVTLRTYRKWESGAPHSNAHFGFLSFASEYDVSLDWIFYGDTARVGKHLQRNSKGKVAIFAR